MSEVRFVGGRKWKREWLTPGRGQPDHLARLRSGEVPTGYAWLRVYDSLQRALANGEAETAERLTRWFMAVYAATGDRLAEPTLKHDGGAVSDRFESNNLRYRRAHLVERDYEDPQVGGVPITMDLLEPTATLDASQVAALKVRDLLRHNRWGIESLPSGKQKGRPASGVTDPDEITVIVNNAHPKYELVVYTEAVCRRGRPTSECRMIRADCARLVNHAFNHDVNANALAGYLSIDLQQVYKLAKSCGSDPATTSASPAAPEPTSPDLPCAADVAGRALGEVGSPSSASPNLSSARRAADLTASRLHMKETTLCPDGQKQNSTAGTKS